MDKEKRLKQWKQWLNEEKWVLLKESFLYALPIDVAEFLIKQSHKNWIPFFSTLNATQQAPIFEYFPIFFQKQLFKKLPKKEVASIFTHLHSDIRANFYRLLSIKEQEQLLPFLPQDIRKNVITLSDYNPQTAGGIMSTDFFVLLHDTTAEEALTKMRKNVPSKKMLYYLYVLDQEMHLMGLLSLKELILTSPTTAIKELLQKEFIFGNIQEDRESIVKKIEKYNFVALPILNHKSQLVGIVKHDDALDIVRKEQTEDMERFMGIVSTEEGNHYLAITPIQHFKRRIGWIVILFFTSFFSCFVIHQHEDLLRSAPYFIFYIPMINDTGGNIASQTASVIIRSLSLGEFDVNSWKKVLWKEFKISLLLMGTLFVFSFLKVTLFSFSVQSLQNLFSLATTISLSLILQVLSSTLIGALLPLFVKYMGVDPVLVANPAITTIVDFLGIIIYFYTIIIFFPIFSHFFSLF